jgi:N-acetylglucosaminyldiphosphoundecaprenol N-acetyl-beta-D-mannosaminyltransferase
LTKRKNAGGEDLWLGLSEGWKILRGGFADKKVEGVELTRKLLRAGGEKGWRIFLLGGWYGVGEKLVKMMRRDFPGIEIISDAGRDDIRPQVDKEIIDRINVFRPDILLVAFGRFRQEKWIAANLKHLKTKVVMGVGSSFDELAGVGPWAWPTPKWVGRMGLKWLWRAVIDPRHIKRAWNAFPCFAWKVFRSKSRD